MQSYIPWPVLLDAEREQEMASALVFPAASAVLPLKVMEGL